MKKFLKRISAALCLTIALTGVLAFGACGGEQGNSSPDTSSVSAGSDTQGSDESQSVSDSIGSSDSSDSTDSSDSSDSSDSTGNVDSSDDEENWTSFY